MRTPRHWRELWIGVMAGLGLVCSPVARATPANRAALERHFDRFLPKSMAQCGTCHQASRKKSPESLEDIPHNVFGARLRELGLQLTRSGKKADIASRLAVVAKEDADGDGVANEAELLLGHAPGDPQDKPTGKELAALGARVEEFTRFLASYRWQPFEPVRRPPLPSTPGSAGPGQGFVARNPVDLFVAAEWTRLGLKPRPEASKEVLLRRVYMDLIGLNPSIAEQEAFLKDESPAAYEAVVDRLLADPRHAERWARHWMDVWRYSDWAGWTDGNQVRDSKPHIWRWRDWIVDSLKLDKPYDRMIQEMLAADEMAPVREESLPATGFLVRNYKMLSREQWLEDTIKHTSQAFLGLTVGCAKCHDHMMDPIPQREYYAMRAIFEPHQVRTDRVPRQLDTAKDGVVRVYDTTNAPTWLFVRGDERHPLTNEVIRPGVPSFLGGHFEVQPVQLPFEAAHPDRRPFVVADTMEAGNEALTKAWEAVRRIRLETNAAPAAVREAELRWDLAQKKHAALLAELAHEASPSRVAATNIVLLQRTVALADATLARQLAQAALDAAATNKVEEARKKLTAADQQLQAALATLAKPLDASFQPRPTENYPDSSTGRRLAFARWVANPANPLTARVAANHVWLRHFGRGIVPTPSDFGRNGRPASHPQLLDWLAAEFMAPTDPAAAPWSFRHLHRLMVTSSVYRMASTPDEADLAADPDNVYLWRMNSRRLEAEAVRDNLLHVAGSLDSAMGGPDIDYKQVLTSRRRSLYLRNAAEKQAEFLQIFDGPSVNECYQRRPSVMPQQALALGNSELALKQARVLAEKLGAESAGDPARFAELAFRSILGRKPTAEETGHCARFLAGTVPVSTAPAAQRGSRAPENLVLVLLNHNDFVTVR